MKQGEIDVKKFKYKCFDCGFEGIDHRDGIGCPKCNGKVIPIGDATDEDIMKAKALRINVRVKDTQLFKDLVEILKQITTDTRIAEDVREYYIEAIDSVLVKEDKG